MFRFAVRNLLSRPARSLLALLGLTVAVVGMVGLFSVAAGIDAVVADTFGRVPGLLVMQRGAPIPLFSRIPAAWAREVERLPGVNVVSAEIWIRANIIDGRNIVSPPRFLFGADVMAHQRMRYGVYDRAMQQGRYLEPEDRGLQRCVVSEQIAREFNVSLTDSLTVNGTPFEIIGIYKTGSLLLDTAIIADQAVVREMALFDHGTVCSFYIEPTGEIPNDQLVEMVRDLFRDRDLKAWQPSMLLTGLGSSLAGSQGSGSGNPLVDLVKAVDHAVRGTSLTAAEAAVRTRPKASGSPTVSDRQPPQNPSSVRASGHDDAEDTGPLDIRSAADWAERFDEFSSDLDLFLGLMTSLGLTIAILSIVNTMLMSVSERIIEFGVLKANGWSRFDVMRLITFESAILGLCGGVTGGTLGWLLTISVNWLWPDQLKLVASPALLAAGLAVSTLLGTTAGLYPAIWATRMMPMDAIRRG